METPIRDNLKARDTWIRGLFMLLFVVLYGVAEIVLTAVVLLQFGFRLVAGQTNRHLLNFGQSLGTYFYQIIMFLTFNTEERPFPFSPWPKGGTLAGDTGEGAASGGAGVAPRGPVPPADYEEAERT